MHIKTINTNSKYKCIVMRGNDPSRVNRERISGRQSAKILWCSVGC